MAKKNIFKTHFGENTEVDDPETLFRDLRGRSQDIKHLWSHQADLLREYKKYERARDVAIELPTGSGKTLVGLLIGEYRRRKYRERVAYLCPTRQLARQVGEQSKKYGINAHVFVGRQREYPPSEFNRFLSGDVLAITTYSAVFNANPRISDAQALILDDAHAGESYIASMWSVEITRDDSPNLYRNVLDLLREGLPDYFYEDVIRSIKSAEEILPRVEMIPGWHVRNVSSGLRGLLESALDEDSSSWHAWQMIKDHLTGCGVFVSEKSVLIRPLIPPSHTHQPFTRANQRLYMSATLGAGGELERVTGVERIDRIPIPVGWDRRGNGRRLFLMPQVSMSDQDAWQVVLDAIRDMERALVLTPTYLETEPLRNELARNGFTVLGAIDIEDSMDLFTTQRKAVLILSRYDGLDLPDDTCRLLVIKGLPSGTNLQERFLWSQVGASCLLRDRVLTRFTQGVGRCTRSDNDYAVVFILGNPLVEFLLKQDMRCLLHPELQAELEFGYKNSIDKCKNDFKELWQAFLEHGEDWRKAEDAIVALRGQKHRESDPASQSLRDVAGYEVCYLRSMWQGDYESALHNAKSVADSLKGDETKGYRGWWYYLAADAAMALQDTNGENRLGDTVREYLKRAGKCCPVMSWFARLARKACDQGEPLQIDEVTAAAIENMRQKLTEWGTVGPRFDQAVQQAINDLQATNHKQFHQGLRVLGEMLGFDAELPSGQGDPDCLWSIGSELYVVLEAKSGHTPKNPIGKNDVLQAQSHEDWVRRNRACNDRSQIHPIIVSPRVTVASEAEAHAKSLCHVSPNQMEALCNEIAAVLRKARAIAPSLSDENVLETLHKAVVTAKLTPHDVVRRLSAEPVKNMPKEGGH